ncbi:MAG: hypothetical protein V3V81_07920 [Candidatus Bathyarchaeia archaeon]
MEKALVKRRKFKVRTIKDLLIKHGNHTSSELPVEMKLDGNGYSKSFQDILDGNSLGISLRYLREATDEVETFGRDLNIQRVQDALLRIMLLSLIVNEHLERQCYLNDWIERRKPCLTDHDC